MKRLFTDHFSAVGASIAPAIIDPCHIPAVNELFSMFPFNTSTDFGFETRLANPEGVCDLFFMIKREQEGVAILAGNSRTASLSPILLNHTFWQKLVALFKAWSDPASILSGKLEVIWLEFDHQGTCYEQIPNLFFNIKKEDRSSGKAQWETVYRVMDEIYALLFGIPFPGELVITLKQCILALPEEGRICMMGLMVPRKTEAVRVILSGLPNDTLLSYLQDIQWPGEQDTVSKLISRYEGKFDYMVYNLHLGTAVLPFLGIEMYFREFRQPAWEPRWKEAFDLLEEDELLLRSKRLGLINFGGRKTISGLLGLRYINRINHLKLVYRKGLPIECKGYFGTIIRPPE